MKNKECDLRQLRAKIVSKGRTDDAADLCELLMSKDPRSRPTAERALHHRWFANYREAIECAIGLNKILSEDKTTLASGNVDLCGRINVEKTVIEYANDIR
jgi:serine/threonine protein kinase